MRMGIANPELMEKYPNIAKNTMVRSAENHVELKRDRNAYAKQATAYAAVNAVRNSQNTVNADISNTDLQSVSPESDLTLTASTIQEALRDNDAVQNLEMDLDFTASPAGRGGQGRNSDLSQKDVKKALNQANKNTPNVDLEDYVDPGKYMRMGIANPELMEKYPNIAKNTMVRSAENHVELKRDRNAYAKQATAYAAVNAIRDSQTDVDVPVEAKVEGNGRRLRK